MVRSDLLRAKSLHAEVEYLRDLKAVGDAKRVADESAAVFKEQQRRFWNEAKAGQRVNSTLPQEAIQNSSQLAPISTAQATSQLERMRQAHSRLQEAHKNKESADSTLNQGLADLTGSQKRIEILEKLLSKAERMRANQLESRITDDVADLVNTSRAVMNLREGRRPTIDFESAAKSTTESVSGKPSQMSVTNLNQTLNGNSIAVLKGHTLQTTLSSGISRAALVTQSGIGISDVALIGEQGSPGLALNCSMGLRGDVGLRITRSEVGGLKVVIDPSTSAVATGVLREKIAIQSRLQALGIKVDTLEVGVAADGIKTAGRNKRARLASNNEEDNESLIA